MLLTELQDILDNIQFADRSIWEALRINSFITCQVNSRKKLKLTDVYRLPFDESEAEQMTKEDFEQMQQQSKALEDYINSQQTMTDKQ